MVETSANVKGKRSRVYLDFKAHIDGQQYRLPELTDIKTVVVEKPDGARENDEVKPFMPYWTRYGRTQTDQLNAARSKGLDVVAGETTRGVERDELDILHRISSNIRFQKLEQNPTLAGIKEYYTALRDREILRNKLVSRTIEEKSRLGGVYASYGFTHSLISDDLRRKGLSLRRSIDYNYFDQNYALIRKLIRGVDPGSVSDREYLEAYAVANLPPEIEKDAISGKPQKEMDSRDYGWSMLVAGTLIENLDDRQLKQVINGRGSVVFTANGLPEPGKASVTRQELMEFLDENARKNPQSDRGRYWVRNREFFKR